jgi:DNA-dependent RNA polymerase auxiliary subunit epsilon
MKEIITLSDFAKIINNIHFISLFNIDNVSYFEFRPSKLKDNAYEIKLCDMSNDDHTKWETQVRIFTLEELKYFNI